MEVEMSGKPVVTHEMIVRALAAYRAAGGDSEACIRAALETALDHGSFGVGDEVICKCGGVTGVIVSITDDEAFVSWASRGKSIEPVANLVHIEHEG
jgi:hypothetical protein